MPWRSRFTGNFINATPSLPTDRQGVFASLCSREQTLGSAYPEMNELSQECQG